MKYENSCSVRKEDTVEGDGGAQVSTGLPGKWDSK